MRADTTRSTLFAISALSLALEVVYTRILSVAYSPFFVYKVIGLSLLGLGAGGILVTLAFAAISRRPAESLLHAVLAFGMAALLPVLVLSRFEDVFAFHSVLSMSLALPFVAAGAAVSIAYACGESARRLYTWNLWGSIVGVALYTFLQERLGALGLVVALAAAAEVVVVLQSLRSRRRLAVALAALAVCLAAFGPLRRFQLPSQSYKWFTLFQRIPTFVHEYSHWDPVAKIDVFSIAADMGTLEEPIPFKILTQDYSAPSFFQRFEDLEAIRRSRMLEEEVRAAGYWIRPAPRKALVIGVGGGPDVQTAIHHGAGSITAVEINPTTLALVRGKYNEFLGGIGNLPQIEYVNEDGGRFLRQAPTRYDFIQLSGVDTDVASVGATSRIAENYLYTVEAFRSIHERLEDDGVAVVLWADFGAFLPVRERMYITALVALRELGVPEPWRRLMVATGQGGFTLLIKKGSPFTDAEVATVRARFDVALSDRNVPRLFRVFPELLRLSSRSRGLQHPKQPEENFFARVHGVIAAEDPPWDDVNRRFNLAPTTNDRPFFFVMDRWQGDTTHFRHLAWDLASAAGVALFLLGIPLFVFRSRERVPGAGNRGHLAAIVFFFAVGLAFMLVEVVLLQKFVYLIGRPTYSVPLVLSALLMAMTIGNTAAARLSRQPRGVLLGAGGLLLLLLAVYAPLLDLLFALCDPLPLWARLLAAALMILPVGLLMGVPFPLGLAVMQASGRRATIPWLLAANATANTIGALLALLLGWNVGFRGSLLIGGLLYLAGTAALASTLSAPAVPATATGEAA